MTAAVQGLPVVQFATPSVSASDLGTAVPAADHHEQRTRSDHLDAPEALDQPVAVHEPVELPVDEPVCLPVRLRQRLRGRVRGRVDGRRQSLTDPPPGTWHPEPVPDDVTGLERVTSDPGRLPAVPPVALPLALPVVLPSRDDRVVASGSQGIGGPAGSRVRSTTTYAIVIALVLTTITCMFGLIAKEPCRSQAWNGDNNYKDLCYSDIGLPVPAARRAG